MRDLFSDIANEESLAMGPSAFVLPGFALDQESVLIEGLASLQQQTSFRHMVTPNGFTMSLALINCGTLGWTSSRFGYRYMSIDPVTGKPWPAIPEGFVEIASEAARAAGFDHFEPNACVINRYLPGAKLSLHQDKHERDMRHPVVTLSLGMTATFLFGGMERGDPTRRVELHHGDAAVWGREDRLRYHGVMPLGDLKHPVMGNQRFSITFRKAD